MKIAFFEIEPWEEAVIRAELTNHELFFFQDAYKEEYSPQIVDCEIVSVFIHSQITREIIDKLPSLRLVVTRSTGYDHIDVSYARERGIIVSNVPAYGEHTVAEHTFALMLSLSRNIHRSHVRRLQNDFSIDGLKGFDLQGKTLGVIGTGKIGINVIQIARAFEMRVIAYDLFPNEDLAIKYGFVYLPLEDVLKTADIVTLHAPYNKDTHHLINRENIAHMKPGTVLINTARGELVDNDALLWGLDNGVLAGCGLDVIEGENLIREEKELVHQAHFDDKKMAELVKDHILLSREEVVYTPHIAFFSKEALERILHTTLDNIKNYTLGTESNVVLK